MWGSNLEARQAELRRKLCGIPAPPPQPEQAAEQVIDRKRMDKRLREFEARIVDGTQIPAAYCRHLARQAFREGWEAAMNEMTRSGR